MLLEFSSDRSPGPPPPAAPFWERSFWPGGVVLGAGAALLMTDSPAGWGGGFLIMAGLGLLNLHLGRRQTDDAREPRQWTITDEQLRAGNQLGSVRWNWNQVRLVVEYPEVYLLYQSAIPLTASFDVPRDVLTPDQDAQLRLFLDRRGLLPGR